eukprot:TRINITY_DN23142_c0_g1_i1.p1 TRINITY_DN23142_c0_g1~~TRINITY_DN23142_c0_g1_i1.p1  ORF type:complete len:480 (+),score=73.82 TRINITY_DN23142_c0_g1_i1:54-1493(+)
MATRVLYSASVQATGALRYRLLEDFDGMTARVAGNVFSARPRDTGVEADEAPLGDVGVDEEIDASALLRQVAARAEGFRRPMARIEAAKHPSSVADAQTAKLLRDAYQSARGDSGSATRALEDALQLLGQLHAAGDHTLGACTVATVLELMAEGTAGLKRHRRDEKLKIALAAKAKRWYTASLHRGVVPTTGSLTSLLTVFVHCGDVDGYAYTLAELRREGLQPTAHMYDLLILGQLAAGSPTQAWATLRLLASKRTPSASQLVYRGLANTIASAAEADEFRMAMRAAKLQMRADVLTAAMEALQRAQLHEEALALHATVQQDGGDRGCDQHMQRVLMRSHAALGQLEAVDALYAEVPHDAMEHYFAEYIKALAQVRQVRLRGSPDDDEVAEMNAVLVEKATRAHAFCIANGHGHGVAPHVALLNLLRDVKDGHAAQEVYKQLPKMHLRNHMGIVAALRACYEAAGWQEQAAALPVAAL